MGRVEAVQRAAKESSEGSYGPKRAWYVDSDILEKLGIDAYKAKVGTNFLRIIPPENPDEYFGMRVFVHFNIGPNNDAYLCPKLMKNERCPLCERRDALLAKEADKEVLKMYSCFPPRYLFFIVDVSSKETEEKGPQIYDAPQGVNEEILGLSKDRRTGEIIDISDPDKGKVLIFDRKGTKAQNTRYSAFELEEGDPVPDDWLAIPTFGEVLKYATTEELEKALAGMGQRAVEPEPEPDPEDDQPVRRRMRASAPAAAPAAAPVAPPAPAPAVEAPVRRRRRLEDVPAAANSAPPAAPAPAALAPAPAATSAPAAPAAEDDVRRRVRERLARHRQGA